MNIPDIGFNHQKSHQAELEILELASLYQRPTHDHDPQAPHRVNFFMVIFVEHGSGQHMVDFVLYPFKAGSMIMVQKEQVHAFDFISRPTGKVLLFTQNFLDQVHANMQLPNYTPTHLNDQYSPLLCLDINDQQRCALMISQMQDEISHLESNKLITMYLFSALAMYLRRLQPELQQKITPEQSQKLARFFELMQLNAIKVRDASWYANSIHTTYKTLNQICKRATKLTAKQMIDAYVVVEMKRCIVVTRKSSQLLAIEFGFDDTSNFVKYFKKHTQLTPSDFKKQFN